MSEVSLFCPAIFLFFVLIARKLVTLINSIYEDTADPGTTPTDHDPRHPAPGYLDPGGGAGKQAVELKKKIHVGNY